MKMSRNPNRWVKSSDRKSLSKQPNGKQVVSSLNCLQARSKSLVIEGQD